MQLIFAYNLSKYYSEIMSESSEVPTPHEFVMIKIPYIENALADHFSKQPIVIGDTLYSEADARKMQAKEAEITAMRGETRQSIIFVPKETMDKISKEPDPQMRQALLMAEIKDVLRTGSFADKLNSAQEQNQIRMSGGSWKARLRQRIFDLLSKKQRRAMADQGQRQGLSYHQIIESMVPEIADSPVAHLPGIGVSREQIKPQMPVQSLPTTRTVFRGPRSRSNQEPTN